MEAGDDMGASPALAEIHPMPSHALARPGAGSGTSAQFGGAEAALERTNEYWVKQDTDGKGRLTHDTHLPVTKRRPNPRPSRY